MELIHHGFPKTLVSDRDTVFLNAVWEEMLCLSGTKLCFSTAYHPQSDGQTEVRNRGLEQYLRAFTSDKPSKWANFLPWAELALNCFHHAGIGMSPFKALYGREPPLLVAAPPSADTPPNVAETIRQRGALLVHLRRNLVSAQQRMVESANRHQRHVEFEVGDMVWLKLQPYRQHSVARPQSAKLARRYYGPFEVMDRIGPVAYRLRLPERSRIHNIFHVSLLREYVAGVEPNARVELPKEFLGGRPIVKPLRIVDSKTLRQTGDARISGMGRWSVGPDLEPWYQFHDRFPDIILGDKDVPIAGGVDTTIPTHEASSIDEDMVVNRGEAEGDDIAEEHSEQSGEPTNRRNLRPRSQIKPPERFANFVAK